MQSYNTEKFDLITDILLLDDCKTRFVTKRQIVDALIKGANPNFISQEGKTPFHHICNNPDVNIEILTCMLSDHNAKEPEEKSPNNWYIDQFTYDNIYNLTHNSKAIMPEIQLIKTIRADPDIKDYNGRTPFSYLCSNQYVETDMLHLMLRFGADARTSDYEGRTAISYLCSNEYIKVSTLKEMLNHADLNVSDKIGKTPFHYLCENISITAQMLVLLLDAGCKFKDNILTLSKFDNHLHLEDIIIMAKLNGILIDTTNSKMEKKYEILFKKELAQLLTNSYNLDLLTQEHKKELKLIIHCLKAVEKNIKTRIPKPIVHSIFAKHNENKKYNTPIGFFNSTASFFANMYSYVDYGMKGVYKYFT